MRISDWSSYVCSSDLAIEDNYEKALATYLDTLIEGFAEANSNWNQLVADAAKAEEELRRARERAEELPVRLKAMAKLTSSVADDRKSDGQGKRWEEGVNRGGSQIIKKKKKKMK